MFLAFSAKSEIVDGMVGEPRALEREIGPQPLKRVDWAHDSDLGSLAAIKEDLQLFQDAIKHSTGETHGYYPVQSRQYAGIVIPDDTPYEYRPTKKDEMQSIAVVLGQEVIITPPGNPDKAIVLRVCDATKEGTEIAVLKFGDEQRGFQKNEMLDREKYRRGLDLEEQARTTAKTDMKQGQLQYEEAGRLMDEARQKKTLEYLKLNPNTLKNRRETFGVEGVKILAEGIKENLLILTPTGAFDIYLSTPMPKT